EPASRTSAIAKPRTLRVYHVPSPARSASATRRLTRRPPGADDAQRYGPPRRGLGSRPALISASRSTYSICALSERKSSAAHFWRASSTAGSIRNRNGLRSGMARSIQGAGVDDRLRRALAAQHDEQVTHHRRLALGIEVDDAALRERVERHLDHRHRTLDDALARRDDRA